MARLPAPLQPYIERFFFTVTKDSKTLDLLGDEIKEPEETRGRKAFEPTEKMRIIVKGLVTMGHSHEFIAKSIGCCEKTLRNYFIPELETGAAQLAGEVFYKLYDCAINKDKSPALNRLVTLITPHDPDTDAPTGDSKQAKPPKLGKKQQDELDATNAHEGSEWENILH